MKIITRKMYSIELFQSDLLQKPVFSEQIYFIVFILNI